MADDDEEARALQWRLDRVQGLLAARARRQLLQAPPGPRDRVVKAWAPLVEADRAGHIRQRL